MKRRGYGWYQFALHQDSADKFLILNIIEASVAVLLKVKDLDVKDPKPDTTAMAEMLYKLNHYQAIDFEIDAITKISIFLAELYPSAPPHEKIKMHEILNVWLLAKFCQYAESLAAYASCFLTGYQDEKDEMVGILKKVVIVFRISPC